MSPELKLAMERHDRGDFIEPLIFAAERGSAPALAALTALIVAYLQSGSMLDDRLADYVARRLQSYPENKTNARG